MKQMLRYFSLILVVSLAFAQAPSDPTRPPDAVDKALRERIAGFYQLLVDGKFRQAEALVADDTKDFFYDMSKPKYLSFEIGQIVYSDEFTRAKAIVLCEQEIPLPAFAGKPLKFPYPSLWKLVDGVWYWYVDQNALRQTPFGVMNPGPPAPSGAMSPGPPQFGATTPPPMPSGVDVQGLLNRLKSQAKADKQTVALKVGESGQVTIANSAEGVVTLSLNVDAPGVDAKLDRTELKAGEKAILTLRAGEQAKPGLVNVRVEQSGQIIPIQVTMN
jgi:hypothetical protein